MTRNVTQHTTVAVCQDCLLILANGCDECTYGPHDDCHALSMSDSEITPGCGDEDCPRCADGGSWFSWDQRCECCGSSTAGVRFVKGSGPTCRHECWPRRDWPRPRGELVPSSVGIGRGAWRRGRACR